MKQREQDYMSAHMQDIKVWNQYLCGTGGRFHCLFPQSQHADFGLQHNNCPVGASLSHITTSVTHRTSHISYITHLFYVLRSFFISINQPLEAH